MALFLFSELFCRWLRRRSTSRRCLFHKKWRFLCFSLHCTETARCLRQIRKRRQKKWIWGSIAATITLGSAVLAWSYFSTGRESSSLDQSHSLEGDSASELWDLNDKVKMCLLYREIRKQEIIITVLWISSYIFLPFLIHKAYFWYCTCTVPRK